MTPEEMFKKAQADLAALYSRPMTHQDILNEYRGLNKIVEERKRKMLDLLDENRLSHIEGLRKRCGIIGHLTETSDYGQYCVICGYKLEAQEKSLRDDLNHHWVTETKTTIPSAPEK